MNTLVNKYYEFMQQFGLYKDVATTKRVQQMYKALGYKDTTEYLICITTQVKEEFTRDILNINNPIKIGLVILRKDLAKYTTWQDCLLDNSGSVKLDVTCPQENAAVVRALLQKFQEDYAI